MKIGLASFAGTRGVMSFTIISALLLAAGIQWGFTAEEQGVVNEFVDIQGSVIDEEGKPVTRFPISCKNLEKGILREVRPNEKGEFTLLRIPRAVETIDCEVGDDRTYEKSQKKIPVNADTQLAFTLNSRTIEGLQGKITDPKGWEIPNAQVRVTQRGVIFSERTNEKGEVSFKKLKVGPATVEYIADGFQEPDWQEISIAEGSNLSASLRLARFPYGLLLLFPAVVVLGLRAGSDWWWGQSADEHSRDTSSILILVSLVSWALTFVWVWLVLRSETSYSLHFFHQGLSFSLAVPIFGFLGTLLFVIDVFQTGKRSENTSMEFVMRLVLGPYVAIVMVLLFSNTFSFVQLSNKLEAQATVAFFSGFLVVLVLQSLSEKGNELLGQWRSATRYEPTEIARLLNLAMEEDLKLKKINLKYLDQLRMLQREDLIQLAKQSELGEGFLLGLKNRALQEYSQARLKELQARIGGEVWKKLKEEGISSVWDLAPLTPARIQELAQKHNIDPAVLAKYSDDAKELLKTS